MRMGVLFSKQENEVEISKRLREFERITNELVQRQRSINSVIQLQGEDIEKLNTEKESVSKWLWQNRFARHETSQCKCKELQGEIDSLRGQLAERDEEIARLHEQIDSQRVTHESVQVYMYTSSMNEKISSAVRSELEKILSGHMEATRDKGLAIQFTQDPQSVPPNKPLIVLCINASRLGTDVEQALQNVTCCQSVTVVVIHHKELHALPPQASEKLLHSDKVQSLYAVVDIAFLTHKGMYPCDMNNKSLDRLTEFICSV
uniref:Uncharacterized protein LOC111129943 n=1 Tax=Crassostrea virginica TaxID=6565 RepID=A0A8B8DWC6_CRAVI|nr:uncharacterized protein LOC111129943 [Crassostrea virginica]